MILFPHTYETAIEEVQYTFDDVRTRSVTDDRARGLLKQHLIRTMRKAFDSRLSVSNKPLLDPLFNYRVLELKDIIYDNQGNFVLILKVDPLFVKIN
jgi:hypothetical protein